MYGQRLNKRKGRSDCPWLPIKQLSDWSLKASFSLQVLGTPVESIKASEDRQSFADGLKQIGEKLAPSTAVYNVRT